MPSEQQLELLRMLGLERGPVTPKAGSQKLIGAKWQAPRPLDLEAIAAMRAELLANPARVLKAARPLGDSEPTLVEEQPTPADVMRLLNMAEASLRTPDETMAALRSNRSEEAYELPPEHHFPGYGDAPLIPIYPRQKQFETVADLPAWGLTAAAALWFRLWTKKPALPVPGGDAVYALERRNNRATVALFSDWANGYYHARYIARHIGALDCAQAIHLGDTYYAGTSSEFDEFVTPVLDPLLRQMPVYLMNANHEMNSHGIPYFEYLQMKRAVGAGYHAQPQETSYFCLRNDDCQVIAIDTAYHDNGRYKNKTLVAWLQARLDEGHASGLITILLSQNPPYGPKVMGDVAAREVRKLYKKDLATMVAGKVDLWFWGDQHYCALFDSSDKAPFVGSCIGHGGYPFDIMTNGAKTGDITSVRWWENESRFPFPDGPRPDRGLNGFCVLDLQAGRVTVTYLDWMRRTRAVAIVERAGGRSVVTQVTP